MKATRETGGKIARARIRPSSTAAALLPPDSKADLAASPDPKWAWHYKRLLVLRDRLFAERSERCAEAAERIEPHSMSIADSASDEIEHNLALAELSAEQDALYEIDEALRRIQGGTYGVCELTGERIPAARLRAVPWTRFGSEAESRLEARGEVQRPHLGKLRSVRQKKRQTLAETDEEEELPIPDDESVNEISVPKPDSARRKRGHKSHAR